MSKVTVETTGTVLKGISMLTASIQGEPRASTILGTGQYSIVLHSTHRRARNPRLVSSRLVPICPPFLIPRSFPFSLPLRHSHSSYLIPHGPCPILTLSLPLLITPRCFPFPLLLTPPHTPPASERNPPLSHISHLTSRISHLCLTSPISTSHLTITPKTKETQSAVPQTRPPGDAPNLQPTTCNLQPATCNLQPTTHTPPPTVQKYEYSTERSRMQDRSHRPVGNQGIYSSYAPLRSFDPFAPFAGAGERGRGGGEGEATTARYRTVLRTVRYEYHTTGPSVRYLSSTRPCRYMSMYLGPYSTWDPYSTVVAEMPCPLLCLAQIEIAVSPGRDRGRMINKLRSSSASLGNEQNRKQKKNRKNV